MGKATDQFQGPVQSLLEQLSSMADGFFKLLPLLAIALIVVFITWMVAKGARKIADRVTAKTEIRPSLKALVDTLVTIFVCTYFFRSASLDVVVSRSIPGKRGNSQWKNKTFWASHMVS